MATRMQAILGLVLVAGLATAEERFPVRVNQAGYLPDAPKWCAMKDPPSKTFLVQKGDVDICWHTVHEGEWVDAPSGSDLKLGDFSCIREPGDYRILIGGTNGTERFRMPDWRPAKQSFHFQVREGAYDMLERMLLTCMTWQRCGSGKGWAGCCHQDPVPLKDADGRTVRTLDARGGYHQSCDLRNWHDGIPMSLYALLRYAELKKPFWDHGEIAEELRWGCDYLLKVIAPEGYVYDAQFAPIGWGPRNYYVAPATLGAQCNVVALLARASRFFRKTDAGYADRLRATACRVWEQVETNPFFERARPAPEPNLPAGSQPAEKCYPLQCRGSATGISERALAGLELSRALGGPEGEPLRAKVKGLGLELVKHLTREGENAGWYFETDGKKALTDWSYCWRISGYRTTLEFWKEFHEDVWKEATLRVADRIVRVLRANDMAPGKGRSSTSSAAAWSLYLSECAELFDRPDYRPWAQRAFDWILGANAWNASFVEGVGQNQWQRPVFGQFFPSTPQLPGAVLHVANGEYDLPPTMMTLWAAAMLR